MSLLGRITQMNDSGALLQESAAMEAEQLRLERRGPIIAALDTHVVEFATSIQERAEVLSHDLSIPRFYQVGDIILRVVPFRDDSTSMVNPRHPGRILENYRVHLVGIRLDDSRLCFEPIGTLRYLTLKGIVDAARTKPLIMALSSIDEVLAGVRAVVDASSRGLCGRKIMIMPGIETFLDGVPDGAEVSGEALKAISPKNPEEEVALAARLTTSEPIMRSCILPANHPGIPCSPIAR